jgi:hypothetical protein
MAGSTVKSALVLGDYAVTTRMLFPGTGALFAMQHNGWDHALKVTGDGGLVGHAGAILLRKAADQAGLTAGLSAALQRAGKSPLFDRSAALVSMAVAIALGATSMSDIAVLAHLSPVLGTAPSGPTARWTLDLAGTAGMLERIARARAKARAHVQRPQQLRAGHLGRGERAAVLGRADGGAGLLCGQPPAFPPRADPGVAPPGAVLRRPAGPARRGGGLPATGIPACSPRYRGGAHRPSSSWWPAVRAAIRIAT